MSWYHVFVCCSYDLSYTDLFVGFPAVVVYVAVLGAVAGLVGMTGVVWSAFLVVFWNTGFALYVAVGAVRMVGMGVGVNGMVVVVAVVVVGVTVVAILLVIGPDGVPRLYARSLCLACMPCTSSCLYVFPSSRTKNKYCLNCTNTQS